jgi:predicted ATPase
MKEFPPFRLDDVNQCLWRQSDDQRSKRISLTPKAFALLRFLVEHPDRLVTHDEILEALWPATYVQSEVLKSHIRDIREALGDDAKKPLFIETLPRRGYQFIAPVADHTTQSKLEVESPEIRLVGRTAELNRLDRSLQAAQRGERQLEFVTGEAGIGKTSLVDAFLQQAGAKHSAIHIARGQCVEGFGGKEPYYPMLEALGQLCQGERRDLISQVLASQAPTWLMQFPSMVKRDQREKLQREVLGAGRERMLREIADALESITATNPMILVLEDLHWVDPSTVDLISAVARRRQQAKLLIIGTFRPVDVLLAEHPLKELKQDLLVHRLCHEIALEPLGEAEVAEYLKSQSSATSLPDGLAALIYRHSEGNPLFMVAALNHTRDRGLIVLEQGSWRLSVPLEKIDLEAPESLRQMIELQIERLSDEEQRALEAMSVLRKFPLSIAEGSAVAGIEPEEFEELLERLAKRHQMIRHAGFRYYNSGPSPAYEFVHVMYRQILYSRIGHTRRSKLHKSMGENGEAMHAVPGPDVAAEFAYQFEEGGDWPQAVKYLLLEAKTAGGRFEPRQAAAILEHALELVNRIPEAERAHSEVDILQKLATIYSATFDPRALETFESLAARAAHYGLAEVEVRALLELALPAARVSFDRYIESLERAHQAQLRWCQGEALHTMAARCQYLGQRIAAGKWEPRDLEEYRKLLTKIREAGDRRLLAQSESGFVLRDSSQYRAACRCAIENLAILSEGFGENPYLYSNYEVYLYLQCTSLMFLGEWGEALRASEERMKTVQKNGGFKTAAEQTQGSLYLYAMDFAGAHQIFETALPLVTQMPVLRRQGLICAASAEIGLGKYDRGLNLLLTCRAEMDGLALMNDWHNRMPLQCAMTEAWLCKGDLTKARTEAEQFLKVTQATEEHTYRALAFETNARVSIAEDDPAMALEHIEKAVREMEGYEVPLAAWRVHATAHDIHQRLGDSTRANEHRELSSVTIMKLANSLPEEEPLHKTFLSAPLIRTILGNT